MTKIVRQQIKAKSRCPQNVLSTNFGFLDPPREGGERRGVFEVSREFPHLTTASGVGVGDPNFVDISILLTISRTYRRFLRAPREQQSLKFISVKSPFPVKKNLVFRGMQEASRTKGMPAQHQTCTEGQNPNQP